MMQTSGGGGGYGPQLNFEKYEHIDYDYPKGFDWEPDGDLHKRIASLILERAHEAHSAISTRHTFWHAMDRKLKAYVSPETIKKMNRAHEHNEEMPCLVEEERIVFPYTYSMLEGLLTYLTSAFIQDPIFQYEGVEADDTIGAALMELIVQVHCTKSKVPLAIHTALRDALAYGYGVAIPTWRRRFGNHTLETSDPKITAALMEMYYEGEIKEEDFPLKLLYEGNALDNISPYMVLADPNVSSVGVQDGEYFGWLERTNYMRLAEDENQSNSQYFNVKYLRQRAPQRSEFALDHSVDDNPGQRGDHSMSATSPVDVIKMYVTLIPSEWELGDSDTPEKWYFELAADRIIIRANPASHAHGMYPVAIASPEFDGYNAFPIGRMEILNGLQDTLDFLFYSHITNVRKAVNNQWIVNPWRININDITNPRPGGIIRTNSDLWNQEIGHSIMQFPVNDVTRGNILDANYITGWMDRVSGADAAMQGFLRQSGPERLTAKEFMGTQQNAVGRLQRLASSISMQFMYDIATMFAVHVKQYISGDSYARLVGRYTEQLQAKFGPNAVINTTQLLSVDYDIIPRDGSLPGGQGAQVMMGMFELMAKSPELMMQFDVPRIFSYIASQFGVKNVDDFRRVAGAFQPQVMPDQRVEQQVQAGNLLPLGGM